MADYIEGKRPVIEVLRVGMPLKCIYMADNLRRDSMVADIERKARKFNVPVVRIARRRLDEISHLEEEGRASHQGVIAETLPFSYVGTRDITSVANSYATKHDGRALVILIDHITDAGNLGAIIRSADAFGASGVIIPNKRSAHVTAATYKSSAGAVVHMPVAQVANLVRSIERLKKEGFWVAGASEKADGVVWDANLKGKIALVVGNEGEGISRLVQENCDFFVRLPQFGCVGSLNVAQAATACMYEWLRQNQASVLRSQQGGA